MEAPRQVIGVGWGGVGWGGSSVSRPCRFTPFIHLIEIPADLRTGLGISEKAKTSCLCHIKQYFSVFQPVTWWLLCNAMASPRWTETISVTDQYDAPPHIQASVYECHYRRIVWSIGCLRWSWRPRPRSVAGWLLRSPFRIPLTALIFVPCICCVLCRWRPARRADHSSRLGLYN